jgi:hypothetical protein
MATQQVTLTDEQLKEKTAKELLALLETISADGRLTDDEVLKLDAWLKSVRPEKLPALTYLRGRVEGVLADRVIIEEERRAIVAAILRVMPQAEREKVRTLFNEAAEHDKQELSWELRTHQETEPATEEQKRCLRAMGREIPANCSKAEALEIVDQALGAGQPVTNRQMMILRFWNKQELAEKGRMAVAEWLDAWYAEDPDRLTAWTLWKEENDDVGRLDPPERVVVDVGEAYLERVKVLGPMLNKEVKKSPLHVRLAALALVAAAVVLLYFMLYRWS